MTKLQHDVKHPPSRFCFETSTSILGNANTKIEMLTFQESLNLKSSISLSTKKYEGHFTAFLYLYDDLQQ